MYKEYPISKILRQLDRDNLLPAIIFRTSRRQCDLDLQQLSRKTYAKADPELQESIRMKIGEIAEHNKWDFELFEKNLHYNSLVTYAAGAHHAGQLLPWRLLLEELMSAGMLRLMIATGTVAAGVDFPARTVVVTAHSKRGHTGFNVLTPSEFQQMSGRAGRRGKDTVGFCLVAPNPYSDARIISDVAKSPPEPLRSSYYASPSSVLNLLKYRDVDELKYIVKNSLAGFVDAQDAALIKNDAKDLENTLGEYDEGSNRHKKLAKKVRRMRKQADQLVSQQDDQLNNTLVALQELGYINDSGKLTEKGNWSAELCTSLVLELSEAIESFLFDDCSMQELVGLVASIAGDTHRNYLKIRKTCLSHEKLSSLSEKVEIVAQNYQSTQFTVEVAVVPEAAATVEAWLEIDNWQEFAGLLRLANVAEGDASRLITQTADHLQQISRLTETHPQLAELAEEARRMLLRPPLSDIL